MLQTMKQLGIQLVKLSLTYQTTPSLQQLRRSTLLLS